MVLEEVEKISASSFVKKKNEKKKADSHLFITQQYFRASWYLTYLHKKPVRWAGVILLHKTGIGGLFFTVEELSRKK